MQYASFDVDAPECGDGQFEPLPSGVSSLLGSICVIVYCSFSLVKLPYIVKFVFCFDLCTFSG